MFRFLLISATILLSSSAEELNVAPYPQPQNPLATFVNQLEYGQSYPYQQQRLPVSTAPISVPVSTETQQQQQVGADVYYSNGETSGDISNYVVPNAIEPQRSSLSQLNQRQSSYYTGNTVPENFIIPVVIPIVRKSPVNILNYIQRYRNPVSVPVTGNDVVVPSTEHPVVLGTQVTEPVIPVTTVPPPVVVSEQPVAAIKSLSTSSSHEVQPPVPVPVQTNVTETLVNSTSTVVSSGQHIDTTRTQQLGSASILLQVPVLLQNSTTVPVSHPVPVPVSSEVPVVTEVPTTVVPPTTVLP